LEIAPFLLEPVLKPKPWGGQSLSRLFGRALPEGEKIGESWELCARRDDSNAITSGPLTGKTLLEVIRAEPEAMLGADTYAACGSNLPVLAKFIDAGDWLSIQVHPDDCVAAALGESDPGKEEAWLVIDAVPGASLVLGTARELTFEKLVELCEQGRYSDCLNFVEVEAGDVIAVPPGTLHAAGKGIVLFEVSQNSDITYRVDDWQRHSLGRELHRDRAREVLTCKPPVRAKEKPDRTGPLTLLHEAEHFRLLEISPGEGTVELEGGTFASITALEGYLEVQAQEAALELGAGMTAFIPASVKRAAVSGAGRAAVLEPRVGGESRQL
jgi:mannose-6-phosphate isomerase